MSSKAGSSGFTLLEILIAVAIMSGIVAVIYSSFFSAKRNVEQAESVRDTTDLARTLMNRLSQDIHNAYCGTLVTGKTIFDGKKQEQDLAGNKQRADSIHLTPLTNWRKPGSKEMDLWEVEYSLKEKADGSGYSLILRENRDMTVSDSSLDWGTAYEITDRVEDFHIRYFRGSTSTWNEEWNGSSQCNLPTAVEVSFTLDDGSFYTTWVDVGNSR